MDEKDLDQTEEQEFDLDSILNEFHDASADSADAADPDVPNDEEVASILGEYSDHPIENQPEAEESAPRQETAEQVSPVFEENGQPDQEAAVSEEQFAYEDADQTDQLPDAESEAEALDISEEEDSQMADRLTEAETADQVFSDFPDQDQEEEPVQEPLVYDPRANLRELKRKLVAGPEKRYYNLSEQGLGRLQIAILTNLVLVVLCTIGAVMYASNLVPQNRMRLMIFSQVLAMLISGLLGMSQMIDGVSELGRGKFTINTLLSITFLSCCVDALFALRDLRVPCCCAFCLEMTFALAARYQRRNTEMGQMDTLRKAVHLYGLSKTEDYYDGKPGFLRKDAALEDFWDNYQVSSGPQKLQSFYAFLSFLLCIGISVLAGMLHGVGMAVQIFSTSLLVAVPASFFVALSRPAAILERRLHMVGSVLCGWKGIKGLSSKAAFPLGDTDLFPRNSTKLNGIKFYSERDPDMIVSYASSLIMAAGGGLVPIFQQLMDSRGVVANPVQNFRLYENGGIGGDVCGESVLVGTCSFLQEMGVMIPEGSTVSQAVYASIDGQLCAVVAISYAKMRSAAAGIVTLCGYSRLTPIFVGGDFILTEGYLRSKFEIKSKRMLFPSVEERIQLRARAPQEDAPSLAISTRPDLISFAYAVTGARALRSSCKAGTALHIAGGILGMLSMLVLAITGSTGLLTPINILLYQLVWLVPGLLITEWARHV